VNIGFKAVNLVPEISVQNSQGSVATVSRGDIATVMRLEKLGILEMNIQEDHVHMVLSIPPKFSVSEVVGFLKGKCAIKIFDKHLELKRRYWGRHFWAKGYCVSTVGLDEEKVRKYVKWQQVKDKRMEQLKLWK
jgi:putative transposase